MSNYAGESRAFSHIGDLCVGAGACDAPSHVGVWTFTLLSSTRSCPVAEILETSISDFAVKNLPQVFKVCLRIIFTS